jgi:glycosyltransferase involved in cell wall biosynthesis
MSLARRLEDPGESGLQVAGNNHFKFLFVSSDKYPPFRVDVSVLFGKKLAGRGHEIDFVLQSDGPCVKAHEAFWSGCRVFVGPTDNGARMLHRARKNLMRIAHELCAVPLLRRGEYDFVLFKDLFFSAFLGFLAARSTGTKFFFWLSYPFPEASLFEAAQGVARYPLVYFLRGHIIGFLLYRLILPHADHVFVQSEKMLKDLAANGVPEERMTPVPMGVEVGEIPFFGYESRLDAAQGEKTLVYLGTLLKVRRIDFLIRVLSKVLDKAPKAKLVFVGAGEDPSDEELILKEARRLGIEDAVTITGFLPQHRAWEYISKADVCLSPFYPSPILDSTSPTKLIEYMGMGKAVVANDHPEQKQVLAQSGGGLCVPYDEDAFSEAILYLLDRPQVAAEMGRRGRAYVESHRDYEIIADKLVRRIGSVL